MSPSMQDVPTAKSHPDHGASHAEAEEPGPTCSPRQSRQAHLTGWRRRASGILPLSAWQCYLLQCIYATVRAHGPGQGK